MKQIKKAAALLLAALLLLSLAACGRSGAGETTPAPEGGLGPAPAETDRNPEDAPAAQGPDAAEEPMEVDMTLTEETAAAVRTLMQGKLEELYAGRFGEEYLALRGIGEEESREEYQLNLSEQTAYFANYFDIENLTEELSEEIAGLWRGIYGMARCTVGEVEAVGDGETFSVSVTVEPMDLIRQMAEHEEEALAPYYQKYGKAGTEGFSEEKLLQADALWAQCILELAREQMAQMRYLEPQTVDVLATLGADGHWTLADNDIYLVDDLIAYFPDLF